MQFHKKGAKKTTQNSSVYLEAHDSGQLNDKEKYFGVIKDIIKLDYRTFKGAIILVQFGKWLKWY